MGHLISRGPSSGRAATRAEDGNLGTSFAVPEPIPAPDYPGQYKSPPEGIGIKRHGDGPAIGTVEAPR